VPLLQSPSVTHCVVSHATPSAAHSTFPGHGSGADATQAPAPLQVSTVSSAFVHADPQTVPAGAYAHEGDEPVHLPLHMVPSPVHGGRSPCGTFPLERGVHAPTWPETLHAAHWSSQGESQHTPSTHWPESVPTLWHSWFDEHTAPTTICVWHV
jgi:hypothetical protein